MASSVTHVVAVAGPSGGPLDDATRRLALGLVESLRARGVRCGWLAFEEPSPSPRMREIGESGVARAVRVGSSGSLAWKPRSGAPVLRDLLREHFPGCRVVLVEGLACELTLTPGDAPGRWRLSGGARALEISAADFAERAGRPRLMAQETH